MSSPAEAVYDRCAAHPEAPAAFQCTRCEALLCRGCAEEGSRLVICRRCGERAVELEETSLPPPPFEPRPAAGEPRRGGGRPAAGGEAEDGFLDQAAVALTHHVVVPAATIAMVAALLFYLVDVRSVFLGGSGSLKWLGFWFVTATVLIARYGKMSSAADRQGCYTAALLAATALAVMVAPWDRGGDGSGTELVNVLIILVTWRFATRLAASLSLEGTEEAPESYRLYGVERLEYETWRDQQAATAVPRKERSGGKGEAPANPSVAVARLAVLALAAFAAGEPFLLAGPPQAGARGLAAMIVFLLATGVVLAAASGIAVLRRVRRLGGRMSIAALPGRVALAAVVMVVLLATALAMPGTAYRGSGALKPRITGGEASLDAEGEPQASGESTPSGDPSRRQGRSASNREVEPTSENRSPPSLGAAGSLLGTLVELGSWLRIPMLLFLAALGLYALWKLWPLLVSWRRGLWGRLRGWLAAFRGLFRRRRAVPAARADPFADLASLGALPPQQAVVGAYGRLLDIMDGLGCPRPERDTPYEFAGAVSRRFRELAGVSDRLTALYVKAAYSDESVEAEDRRGAIRALEELRTKLAGRAA